MVTSLGFVLGLIRRSSRVLLISNQPKFTLQFVVCLSVEHEFHEICHSVTFCFMKKKTPNDDVTPLRHSQFTPKMKANAVSRLLSSLV